jgi:hypothetical protein
MSIQTGTERHRWLLGLEPFFEGGWLHRGRRAHHWAVEDALTAVALLGDVTIELAHTKSLPEKVDIKAWSIFRDVDIVVPAGTHVQIAGRTFRGSFANRVADSSGSTPDHVVSIHGLALLGDVNVRVADHTPICE